jgi:hypothetical protein
MLTLIIFQTKEVKHNEEQGIIRPEMSHMRELDAFSLEEERERQRYHNLFLP